MLNSDIKYNIISDAAKKGDIEKVKAHLDTISTLTFSDLAYYYCCVYEAAFALDSDELLLFLDSYIGETNFGYESNEDRMSLAFSLTCTESTILTAFKNDLPILRNANILALFKSNPCATKKAVTLFGMNDDESDDIISHIFKEPTLDDVCFIIKYFEDKKNADMLITRYYHQNNLDILSSVIPYEYMGDILLSLVFATAVRKLEISIMEELLINHENLHIPERHIRFTFINYLKASKRSPLEAMEILPLKYQPYVLNQISTSL